MIIRTFVLVTILVVVIVLAVMAWQWFRTRAAQQALRDNPPDRVALLIRLPKEAERSNVKMARFYARLERLTSHNPELIATNQNVVSAALVGTGAGQSQAPIVRFIMWVPREMNDRIQMELQECYEGQAQITELPVDEDPLTHWAEKHKEYMAWEAQQQQEQEAQDSRPPLQSGFED